MNQSLARSLSLAVLLLAGCAHRYPANAGGDRDAVAGIPVSFGDPLLKQPDGTTVAWEFSDGAKAEGAVVSHVFARAGEYKAKVTVKDAKEPRTSEATVRVARRPPAAAVPKDARMVVLLDRLFARLPKHLALLELFAGADRTGALLRSAEQILGFDATRPENVLEAGIDPEEGMALAWLPNDNGLWLIFGTYDDRAAMEAARRALSRGTQVKFSPGPDGSTLAQVGALTFQLLASGGYLYVHFPDLKNGADAATAGLAAIAKGPPEGLFADPLFAAARRQVAGEDLFTFLRPSEIPKSPDLPSHATGLVARARALSVGVTSKEGRIEANSLLSLEAEGLKLLAELCAAPHKADVTRRAPPGAAIFASASLNPKVLTSLLGDDHSQSFLDLDGTLRGLFGVPLDAALGLLSGDLSTAVYVDVAGLYRDLAARHMPTPKFNVVSEIGVLDEKAARVALESAAETQKSKGKPPTAVSGGYTWILDGQPAGAIVSGPQIVAGYGGNFLKALDPKPDERRLAASLKDTLPLATLAGPHVLVYADVGSVIDAVRNPPPMADVDPMQLVFLKSMVASVIEDPSFAARPLLPVKDVVLQLIPGAGGLEGHAVLRTR